MYSIESVIQKPTTEGNQKGSRGTKRITVEDLSSPSSGKQKKVTH
jgi:hypothetical protein